MLPKMVSKIVIKNKCLYIYMYLFIVNYFSIGKLDILQYLLKEVKVDSKARDKSGSTIMHAATTGHQLAIVKVCMHANDYICFMII